MFPVLPKADVCHPTSYIHPETKSSSWELVLPETDQLLSANAARFVLNGSKAVVVSVCNEGEVEFRNKNMFRESQPKYKFYCKCQDEQFHGFI